MKVQLMKNYKVSIIIPVFNVEKYLENCLKSAINQTLDDVEIICINDGSTDDSVNILKKYSKYIKTINQENKGLGATRKVGLDASSGDYILFLDSDDFIKDNACEILYNQAVCSDSDMVFYNICHYFEKQNKYLSVSQNMIPTMFEEGTNFDCKVINYEDIKPFVLNRHFATWSKFYKAKFLKKYDDLYFPEHVMNEDVPLHVQLMLRAEKISWCWNKLYFYRQSNIQSLTNTITSTEKAFQLFDMFKETEKNLVKENKLEEFEIEFIEHKLNFLDIRLNRASEDIIENFFIKSKKEINDWELNDETINHLPDFAKAIYLRFIKSDNYLEYNILKKANNEEIAKIKKTHYKKFRKYRRRYSRCQEELNSLKNSTSWKITKPFRKITSFIKQKTSRRICLVDTTYSLLLYLLITNRNKSDIFIFGEGMPENIHKRLNAISFPYATNKKRHKLNILILRIKIFFKTLFNFKIEVYGHDHIRFAFPLYEYKNSYVIEDGEGNYLDTSPRKRKTSKFKEKKLTFFGDHRQYQWKYGRHSNIKKVYLTKNKGIPKNIKNKVEIINIEKLWNKKSTEEQAEILKIFGFEKNKLNIDEESIIFFTQPFSEDRILTKDEEINLYKKVLSKYDGERIIIKTHPRDKKDYSKIFPNYTIIDGELPAEFIFLLNINIKKVSTIYSSAVTVFDEEKIDFFGTKVHPKLLKKFDISKEDILSRK